MFQKIIVLSFTASLFAVSGFAQSDCQTTAIAKLKAEAVSLGLRPQGNYTFQSVGNVHMAFVPVIVGTSDKIRTKLVRNGMRIKFAYIQSQKSGPLATGFFFIQSSPASREIKPGVVREQKVSLFSPDGRTTEDLPGIVACYQLPKPAFRHYWTRLIIHGGAFWVDGEPE